MSDLALSLIRKAKEENSTYLDLGRCGLTELPIELFDLIHIETLILSNGWWDWQKRKTIQSQNSGEPNRLSKLPKEIRRLRTLKTLIVAGAWRREWEISDLTPLKELTALTLLDFSHNQVSDLTPLKKLTALTQLDFGGNEVSDLTPLNELTALTLLDFRDNDVSDLKPLLSLIRRGTPVRWERRGTDGQIVVGGNIFFFPPPEIVQQGNETILRYFEEIVRKGKRKLYEARLLIVGQGGAGKTTLKRKLQDVNAEMPAPADSTKGIEINSMNMRASGGTEFTLHVWDFGGQNIQHYAHQFFLSGSSLYVLVHNQREQNTNFQYWLNIIEMLGGVSPIIIVQNEVAGHLEPIQNAPAIRERFPNVVSPFYQVDLSKAATDARFEKLREAIALYASDPQRLPHFGKEYPVSFVNVRDKLDQFAQQNQHIAWQQFAELCKQEGVTDEALMTDFSRTLTVLGVCLHLENDIELRNFVFLHPKWIIDALFDLLYHQKIVDQHGEFSEQDTFTIWSKPEYQGMHGKLIRLMVNFELCYRIKDSERFIVPQRLPATTEQFPWSEEETRRVLYRYKFMPKGLITRLTCRLHPKIENDHVWSDAVIFAMGDTARAFVRERYSENEIWIDAAGNKSDQLLTRIVDEMDDIHATSNYANLRVEKLVPCTCDVCSREKEPHHFDYDYLNRLLDEGETRERCQKSRRMVDIQSFLAKTGIRPRREGKKLKVFLSYSHIDEEMKVELDNHLSALKRPGKIETWNDRKILPGEEWDDSIKRELREADIILLLVSSDFNASKYIWEVEVKHAIERHKKGEAKVVPVCLRHCDFDGLPYAGLQGLPKDMKPVTSYRDKDEAYLEIAMGVRALVDEMSRR